ncbi:hypothetical protein [Streptomyces sp. NPDC050564]|uniref:hypothetical protein n=1 Tax=Streptomyces sp. NPDC050564 TaxID=3365631 RepID=UPI003788E262
MTSVDYANASPVQQVVVAAGASLPPAAAADGVTPKGEWAIRYRSDLNQWSVFPDH